MSALVGFDQVLSSLADGVALVEDELRSLVDSPVQLVADVGRHTLEAGGKRLRPAFVNLAARATRCPYEISRAVRLGAAMELVHMATLIHDDVIDNADTRRGRATAAAIFGNTASILSGDVMLARAMVVLAEDGDLEVIRTVSRAVVEMAEGEARELETRGRYDLPEEEHLAILRMKTASFVEGCCAVGATIAGADDELRNALSCYGHHIGMAFQIIDDVIDFREEESVTGKPRATDFREGCATLALIRLRSHTSPEEGEEIRTLFGNGVTDSQIDDLVEKMRRTGALHEAEDVARAHVDSAIRALGPVPTSEDKALLVALGEFVLQRSA